MDMSPLPPGDVPLPPMKAVTPALLRRGALWGGGGVARLVRILHVLGPPACRRPAAAPCAMASASAAGAGARLRAATGTICIRMAVFARELMEYAGGDQMSVRKHLNGALFDGGRPPWYAEALLRDVRETIMLTWLYSAQWDHVYRDTRDAHHRVMELPSASMPEWRPPQVVLVLGDVHGSFHSLLRNLMHMQRLGYLDNDFRLRPDVMLVGLGDYVDYGPYGMEVLWTLLWLQLLNRKNVVLLGGNHEDVGQNEVVGGMPDNFALELNKRFGNAWSRFKPAAAQLYRTMPRALKCRVGEYELQFSHGCGAALHAMGEGGISSELGEQTPGRTCTRKRPRNPPPRGQRDGLRNRYIGGDAGLRRALRGAPQVHAYRNMSHAKYLIRLHVVGGRSILRMDSLADRSTFGCLHQLALDHHGAPQHVRPVLPRGVFLVCR